MRDWWFGLVALWIMILRCSDSFLYSISDAFILVYNQLNVIYINTTRGNLIQCGTTVVHHLFGPLSAWKHSNGFDVANILC